MNTLRALLTLLTCATVSLTLVHGKEMEFVDREEYSQAYQETSRIASWSAYIPIAATLAAAAWFGFADENQSDKSSGGSGGHNH
jgi:hypothetical protein